MKTTLISTILFICAMFANAQEFTFNHGPYLQNMTDSEVTVYFTTSKKAFSWVEVTGDKWTAPKRFATTFAGQYDAYTTLNRVRIDGLRPGVKYRYRLISKEFKEYHPYKVVYGDSIASSWEEFRTLNPRQKNLSFVLINDGHDNPDKVQNLLGKFPLDNVDMVFYVGDMIGHYDEEEQPYYGFIDPSVEIFAKSKPFIAMRGNHEVRGNLTRNYINIIGCPDNRFYNIIYLGNTAIVILDTGETKPDTYKARGGLNVFYSYRTEQFEWLKNEAETKRFKAAKHKIVLMHVPPMVFDDPTSSSEHAAIGLEKNFKPLFNEIGIDMTISGHLHSHELVEKGKNGNDFTIITNDNHSVMHVKCDKKGIGIKIINEKDEVLLDRLFK